MAQHNTPVSKLTNQNNDISVYRLIGEGENTKYVGKDNSVVSVNNGVIRTEFPDGRVIEQIAIDLGNFN